MVGVFLVQSESRRPSIITTPSSYPVMPDSMPMINVYRGVLNSVLEQIVETRVQDSVSQSAMLAHMSLALSSLGTDALAQVDSATRVSGGIPFGFHLPVHQLDRLPFPMGDRFPIC